MLQTIQWRSPYILRCEVLGHLEKGPADGRMALLLELCECSLASYLDRHGPIPEEQAFTWMKQVGALAALVGCR
jgi:hypothetical protein